jgi:uncharacterized protein
MTIRRVNCPSCGAQVSWTPESRYRPFCSERCKMMDLGAWATEKFRVAGDDDETDVDAHHRGEGDSPR